MGEAFGDLLRDWRHARRLSQLELGLAANVSARHIAFLETGRARPSRSMVLQLSQTMSVPRGARNTMLTAAGFAAVYRQRAMSDAEMEPIRAAVAWTLQRHDPFPAIALDRHWRVVAANIAAQSMLSAVGMGEGSSMLEAAIEGERLRAVLLNWPEVAHHFIARLRLESASLGGDDILDAAIRELALQAGNETQSNIGDLAAVIPARYCFGDVTLSLFSTLAHFGTAEDIALADVKIELMFPADETTREFLMAKGGQSN